MHKSILVEKSIYFRDYFRKGFRAGNTVELYGYDSHAFTHIVDFVYNSPAPIEHENEIPSIIDTYALASELDIETCMNSCVDRLRAYAARVFLDAGSLIHVYEKTNLTPTAEIRKFLIDQIAYQLVYEPDTGLIFKRDKLMQGTRDLMMTADRELLAELMRAQLVFAKRYKHNDYDKEWFRCQDPSKMYGCRYHVHDYTECHLVNNERGLVKYRPQY